MAHSSIPRRYADACVQTEDLDVEFEPNDVAHQIFSYSIEPLSYYEQRSLHGFRGKHGRVVSLPPARLVDDDLRQSLMEEGTLGSAFEANSRRRLGKRRVASMPGPVEDMNLIQFVESTSSYQTEEQLPLKKFIDFSQDLPPVVPKVCLQTPSPINRTPPSSPDSVIIVSNSASEFPRSFLRTPQTLSPVVTSPAPENGLTDWIFPTSPTVGSTPLLTTPDTYSSHVWNSSPPKPIPALYGPLSLPYARCPSGAEGVLFDDKITGKTVRDVDGSKQSAGKVQTGDTKKGQLINVFQSTSKFKSKPSSGASPRRLPTSSGFASSTNPWAMSDDAPDPAKYELQELLHLKAPSLNPWAPTDSEAIGGWNATDVQTMYSRNQVQLAYLEKIMRALDLGDHSQLDEEAPISFAPLVVYDENALTFTSSDDHYVEPEELKSPSFSFSPFSPAFIPSSALAVTIPEPVLQPSVRQSNASQPPESSKVNMVTNTTPKPSDSLNPILPVNDAVFETDGSTWVEASGLKEVSASDEHSEVTKNPRFTPISRTKFNNPRSIPLAKLASRHANTPSLEKIQEEPAGEGHNRTQSEPVNDLVPSAWPQQFFPRRLSLSSSFTPIRELPQQMAIPERLQVVEHMDPFIVSQSLGLPAKEGPLPQGPVATTTADIQNEPSRSATTITHVLNESSRSVTVSSQTRAPSSATTAATDRKPQRKQGAEEVTLRKNERQPRPRAIPQGTPLSSMENRGNAGESTISGSTRRRRRGGKGA